MKLQYHAAVSAVSAGILYVIFKSWALSAALFITGVCIDLDHVLDYFLENGMDINIKKFFSFFYEERHRKITLLLHGWEWLILLGICVKITNWNLWVTGALIGYSLHIILDYFYSKAPFRSYSLIWKWGKKFNSELIFPRNRGYHPK